VHQLEIKVLITTDARCNHEDHKFNFVLKKRQLSLHCTYFRGKQMDVFKKKFKGRRLMS